MECIDLSMRFGVRSGVHQLVDAGQRSCGHTQRQAVALQKEERTMPIEEVAGFSVSYLQVLDEEGNADEGLDPKLSDDQLKELYTHMVRGREADQRMLKLQRQGRIGTFGPSTGQEAAHCASTFALTEKDWFVGAFREAGARLARGETIAQAFLMYNGYEEGNVHPTGGRTLPLTIIVGAQALHAVGIGYAMKHRGESDSAVLVFFGDGATSEGDFHEAMNFAAVWKAPVVFLCQNNQWAISVPRSKQTNARTLAQKAIAYDMPGIQVDGNDALAVYKATREALDRAHAGEGPTLIEANTYRLMDHTTADDASKYRDPKDVEEWWKRDPIPRLRKYMEKRGVWDDKQQKKLDKQMADEVEAAVREFESMKDFNPDAPFDHVFGTKHDEIEEQRAEFLASRVREGADG
jgi:pyruvate dehydrogenase E1 component alpha subunit